jgi:predicted PhzF superfamily epimerase YddE/YHI9
VRVAIRCCNTFTGSRHGGNPTPVIALPRWLEDAALLALARESGQAYTSFWVTWEPTR